jgi:DNA-directed RNA polymerase omega subunit
VGSRSVVVFDLLGPLALDITSSLSYNQISNSPLGDKMARITSETAGQAVGGLYDLVLIACRRTRELRSGWAPEIESDNGELVTAIREIEKGKIGRDYLLKPPVVERQRRGTKSQ